MAFTSKILDETCSTAQDLREMIRGLELGCNTYSGCGVKADDRDGAICQRGTYCEECSKGMATVEDELESAKSLLPLWEDLEDHFPITGSVTTR